MKKLIAIAVVLVLAVGAAFAVDLTGTVFGHVNVIKGDSGDDSKLEADGGMDRVRIDGSGEGGDGKFGGYIRVQGYPGFDSVESVYAWWKPIDQFKLIIGGFGDAFWGKEGVTGWMFNQMPYDSSVAINPGVWCGAYWGSSIFDGGATAYLHNRYVFLEGFQYYGAALEIKPLDMLSVNIGLPFISQPRGTEAGDIFQAALAQIDLNFDFGNIALTYDGANRAGMKGADGNGGGADGGAFYLYYGGSFGDLGLDVGFSYHFAGAADADRPGWGDSDAAQPIGLGLGVKYASGAFGVKVRATAALGGDDEQTYVNASLLPYYAINDNISAFLNAGLGMIANDDDTAVGFYINPYLRVGAEWGPTFYIGFQLWSELAVDGKAMDGSDSVVKFAIPVALMISF